MSLLYSLVLSNENGQNVEQKIDIEESDLKPCDNNKKDNNNKAG